MTFVTPALLFGAALMAVPVVLHLIMRQQPRRLIFPPLRFVQARRESNRRRLRLRHLLLLFLRCAAVACLALALARPSIQGSGWLGGREAPVAAALVIDTGPAMAYRRNGKPRIDDVREIALWLLKQLPPDSDVAVLGSQYVPSVFSVDRAAAAAIVERMRVDPGSPPVARRVDDALRLVDQSDKKQREVYVFTDLNRAGWPDAASRAIQARLKQADDIDLYFIDVGVADPMNSGLGDLRLSSDTIPANGSVRFQTELLHRGPESQCGVELLLVDASGKTSKRGNVMLNAREGTPQPVEFPPIVLDAGLHQGFVRIVGEDGLAWDDARYFTVDVRQVAPVLVAAPYPQRAVFFTNALLAGSSALRCEVVPQSALSQQQLADFAAIVLLDPEPLSQQAWNQILDYVEPGGRGAIFLGPAARPADALNSAAAQSLLAAPLIRHWHESTYLVTDARTHPALGTLQQFEVSVPWQAFPVATFWQMGELAPDAQIIARYATGHPAIVERPVGRGKFITVTTPVSDPLNLAGRAPWNVLPTAPDPWPFLLLMDGLASHLVGLNEARLNYTVGEPVSVKLPAGPRPNIVLVETPDNDRIKQPIDPQQNRIVFTSVTGVGNYRIRAGGGAAVDGGFSANVASERTLLDRASPGELAAWLGAADVPIARNRDEIDRNVNVGRVGRELFSYLICVVAILVGLEHLLSNRFYRAAT